ncbi:phage protein NinX family protein [Caballeronia zhejiangensis]|uniref:phage protein NinX family protein n=1 Tax=Caballeronia zhejiangensis TaxID=871203 RepID=UPI001FD43EEA|nr:phage protein NinX family protein [Caballeronia zhejiangensis]
MKVTELIGPLLDYWVARATRIEDVVSIQKSVLGVEACYLLDTEDNTWRLFCPSVRWADGGPIIARFAIAIWRGEGRWLAILPGSNGGAYSGGDDYIDARGYDCYAGATPLIAAMRAYVASKFGESVDDSETQR